jgi:hypothetical protein
MSAGSRRPFVEDVILDLILGLDLVSATSLQDLKLLVKSKLKGWLHQDDSYSLADLSDRIALKANIYLQSRTVPSGTKLGKLILSMKKTSFVSELLVIYTNSSQGASLNIATPVIAEADDESIKSLSHLIELACLVHSVKPENVRLSTNSNYESKISMSSSFWKLVDNLKISAKSTSGDFNGPNVMFTGSRYTSSPVGVLASMRLLQQKDHLLRKQRGKDKLSVTFFMLQQKFNDTLGIRAEDSKSYAVRLLKSIMASCVKAHNVGFPGGWIHKNREINKVKTDAGLVQLLGWTEKIVSPYKLLEVLFNPVDNSFGVVDGKQKIIGRSMENLSQKGRNMSHQEFRTAVLLTVPRLELTKPDDFEKDSKREPLDFKNPSVADAFCSNDMIEISESLNQAFAFKVSIKNPKSKTNLTHYENARGRLLASTANKKIIDNKGKEYDSFIDLPVKTQEFLRKKYRYPVKAKRPNASTAENAEEEDMEVDDVSANQSLARKKTVKLTKGEAAKMRAAHARKGKATISKKK